MHPVSRLPVSDSEFCMRRSACRHLRSLRLSRAGLTVEQLDEMRRSWDRTVQLTALDVSHNNVGDAGIMAVSKMIIAFTGLRWVRGVRGAVP